MTLQSLYLLVLTGCSAVSLLLFALDKSCAKHANKRRVPESVLLALTCFGGAVGALFGMYFCHHKTNFKEKYYFAITAWIALLIQFSMLVLLMLYQ